MTFRSLALALPLALPLLLALTAAPAAAQPAQTPPRALVRQLFTDMDADDDLKRNGIGQVAASITVSRRDLNGDGVAEWLVDGIRCNANCPKWIYRRLADGRFEQVFEGAGAALEVLPVRARGWSSLLSRGHVSCCEAIHTRYEFDGRHYAWRDSEYRGDSNTPAPKTVYHVSLVGADARAGRRLVLDPMNAGGGLWISARADACAAGQRCGAPELVLASTALPAGRVCVVYRSVSPEQREYRSAPGEGWCGVTTVAPLPDRRAGRRLVLHPTTRDWARMGSVYDLKLTGPGLPAQLDLDAAGAVMEFGTRLGDTRR